MSKQIESSESEKDAVVDHAIDSDAEKRLLKKLDWILLPMFTLIYCMNFIDRTAIGNAKIAGIEKDLNMQGFDFNIALTVFFILYISAEIPSNLMLKHFGSVWLAGLVTGFGIVSIGTAFVKSFAGLIITRVFLGIAEGGTLSGLTYIMSRYYRRSELVLRLGIFFGVSTNLAGAFGGLLASGLLSLKDIGTVMSWRKIFLVEGIITTGFGLLCFIILPTDPQHTRMLNPQERALALTRIDADQATRVGGMRERTTWKLVWRAFNFNTAICSICYLMINVSFQGLSLFMPTVIATLGKYTTVQSQLRTVPPYVLGAVWIIFNAYYCYRKNQRAIPIFFSTLLIVLGYAIAIGTKNPHARYAACFLSIAGSSTSGPVLLTWGTNNAAPDTIRAVATAIIPGIGALGSVIAVWTYLPSDAPNYHKGNTLNLATSSTACVLVVIGALYIRWENAKRERGERDYRLEGKSAEEIEQLGYLDPRFRYQV
ncbi:MFS general substrate transporter [Desarmillaria tabescens]|uniref:MFS general substrate transporter n=1 Tax=Armillaria tabescens TaxID=1929756 RepID=A0AA39T623_ARMTA|nr:MFS general substrate transporter [Desarmillaria tabescens]KAK0466946.1 MFS general substrate transporter [Desarmillaria tabescens]